MDPDPDANRDGSASFCRIRKNGFYALYDLGCSSRILIRILTFYPSRIPDPGVKKATLNKSMLWTRIWIRIKLKGRTRIRIRINARSWIRICIRIKVISWFRIRINLQMTSLNVWKMSLLENFFIFGPLFGRIYQKQKSTVVCCCF